MIDDGIGFVVHDERYAIIGSKSQAISCDNRHCDSRTRMANGRMAKRPEIRPEFAEVFERLERAGKSQRQLAEVLSIEENKISKVRAGERQFRGTELIRALKWLSSIEEGREVASDLPDDDPRVEYVEVEVLPTFAGMGGGGTGDGDRAMALVPRALIVDVLRGRPSDFLLIDVRGDSMEPDFRHGDQILVDKRDVSPAQPGPFALWDGDWGEYVVKNVERVRSGEVRIFSSNPKYSQEAAPAEATRIIGRPVWFGRRL